MIKALTPWLTQHVGSTEISRFIVDHRAVAGPLVLYSWCWMLSKKHFFSVTVVLLFLQHGALLMAKSFLDDWAENTAPGVSARAPPGKDLASIARRSSSVKRRLSEVIRRISSGFLGAAPASHLTDEDFMRLSPITGSWEVDRSRSDDYSSLVKLMKLGWAFSKALENSKTLHVGFEVLSMKTMLWSLWCFHQVDFTTQY